MSRYFERLAGRVGSAGPRPSGGSVPGRRAELAVVDQERQAPPSGGEASLAAAESSEIPPHDIPPAPVADQVREAVAARVPPLRPQPRVASGIEPIAAAPDLGATSPAQRATSTAMDVAREVSAPVVAVASPEPAAQIAGDAGPVAPPRVRPTNRSPAADDKPVAPRAKASAAPARAGAPPGTGTPPAERDALEVRIGTVTIEVKAPAPASVPARREVGETAPRFSMSRYHLRWG